MSNAVTTQSGEPLSNASSERREWLITLWSVVAAFGTYFCMYGFRKPFTAATYDTVTLWGMNEKTVLVIAQVMGYMVSKFIGIRVISEMRPPLRAVGILGLIGFAELALFLFAVVPRPYHVACLFLNGLPLGMVFGLVLGFLEGRQQTEALTAGLCASFILADGVTKSLGEWLLKVWLISERWMPCLAGLSFSLPLCLFVWMLTRIPAPTLADVSARSERTPMTRLQRRELIWKYGPGIFAIVMIYLLVTILRSVRSDFSKEIWMGLGRTTAPSVFTTSEMLVALGVLVVNGLGILIRDNRRAFFASLQVALAGIALLGCALLGLQRGALSDFVFMVLIGLGLYLPYVAIHTTVFERLIAMTRERGNLGFLMYVADAIGYLGYVAVIIGKEFLPRSNHLLGFFIEISWIVFGLSIFAWALAWIYFQRTSKVSGELLIET